MGDLIGGSLVVMGPGSHACWGYIDQDSFWRDAAAFLDEGIRAGERALSVGPESSRLTSAHVPAGVGTLATEDFYGRPPCRDLDDWEGKLRHLVEGTLADGYAGLRIVSDGTAVVGETDEASLIAWELRVGRLVSDYPLRVVCGFQPSEVDKDKVADLVSVHTSLAGPIPVPLATFHLGAGTLTLRGELDATTLHLLDVALSQIEDDLTVDMAGVEFMDLRSVRRLGRFVEDARSRGRTIRLEGVPDIVERTWDLLQGQW